MQVENLVVSEVEVFQGTTKTGPRAGRPFSKYTIIGEDGNKYSCGFDKPPCSAGDTVSFTVSPPDQWSNGAQIVAKNSLRMVSKGTGPAKAPTISQPAGGKGGGFNTVFPVPPGHDRNATLRMSALEKATNFCSAFAENPTPP